MLWHVTGFLSFVRLRSIQLYVCNEHIFFIQSSVDGRLGFFPLLALVNSAAVTMDVQICLRSCFE